MDPDDKQSVLEEMKSEWDERARRDAHFYVAFGRRSQTEDEFLASAAEVMPSLEAEFVRLPPGAKSGRRALEIGCGPGRLMIRMAEHFGEVHGVDISAEMVALARQRLREVPNTQVHLSSGRDLGMFEENFFDFIYSYIVFQHIPEQSIVLNYLSECRRILKPGGILRCQIRGAPPLASEMRLESRTWTGCFFREDEILQFSREQAFPLVSISGLNTQYMWTTFRKADSSAASGTFEQTVVKAVTSASGGESRVPGSGRDAAVSLWINGMPVNAGLAELSVSFNNLSHAGCYLSPVSQDGGCQMNSRLPKGLPAGDCTVTLMSGDRQIPQSHSILIFPAAPQKPFVTGVTDGVNVASDRRLETRTAKVTIENAEDPALYSFRVGGLPAEYLQYECLDPITATWVFAFHVNKAVRAGTSSIQVCKGKDEVATIPVELT